MVRKVLTLVPYTRVGMEVTMGGEGGADYPVSISLPP